MSRKKDVDLDLTGFAELFMNDTSIPENLGVVSVPTVMLFKDGKLIKSKTGIMTLEEIDSFWGKEV